MNQDYLKANLESMENPVTLKQLQKYVNDMIEIRGFQGNTPQEIMLFLTEELGELAKEIRKATHLHVDTQKINELDVEGEIADIFIYLLSLCHVMNINLEEAFKNKEKKNCEREWKVQK